ncbi:hypothetical protein TanjilG_19971 [Lupinus angustifolius]|uniref:DUF668 domain-containing protein n=1 Tax=Lupinus angustifolius TaxID=3871 RepID=A0A4P1RC68_LUPAN|nr:PREDICTED: uncharacterized protein LOC109352073 [Lupinus angustifolius]OIW07870.1 hypothetical protein TanjilG_19971 [Lupinus angustifolius]
MALETLLIKVKTAFSHSFNPVQPLNPKKHLLKKKPKNVGVLAFEIASVISKLLHLWQSLSDANIIRLRNDAVSLEGVLKLISNDESFLLSLARAEFAESLRLVSDSISRLSVKCHDPTLRSFHRVFTEFANSGFDPLTWTLTCHKDIEARRKKLELYVSLTQTLHREMEELSVLESGLKKSLLCHNNNSNEKIEACSSSIGKDHHKICDLQHKILCQKHEVKELKEKSLWNKGFDGVVLLLVRFCFTVLARLKIVFFGIGPYLSRSLSASAAVYPSATTFISGPLKSSKLELEKREDFGSGFFESNCKVLKQGKNTLGDSALALHYSNLIIVMEKMIKSPQLVGMEARSDLYAMLPSSIRSSLRSRLKGSVGFCASDPALAGEWRDALGRILGWLSPLAHNMIKWQNERSFEHQNLVTKTNVLLLQTLFFANKDKTEAAITELLVGLNYIWRFEREMTAKALFQCVNFNGFLNLNKSS